MEDEIVPPSRVQTLSSELFRITLCRNDDYNLACSSLQKALGKSKLMKDMTLRENERIARETEIMKELTLVTKPTFLIVESHTRKMVKKILSLCFQEGKN